MQYITYQILKSNTKSIVKPFSRVTQDEINQAKAIVLKESSWDKESIQELQRYGAFRGSQIQSNSMILLNYALKMIDYEEKNSFSNKKLSSVLK